MHKVVAPELLFVENSSATTFVHNFVHNSPMWQIVVGGGVMVGHPSTNHNSPRGWVVHKSSGTRIFCEFIIKLQSVTMVIV